MIQNILFDLDGTLTDPAEGIIGSIQYACRELEMPVPAYEELLFAIGPPIQSTFGTLLGTDDAQAIQRAVNLYRERYSSRGMLFENAVYPGVVEMLVNLNAAGKQLYVATSKPVVYAVRILRHFNLDSQLTAIHGSELDGTRTNKADLIAYILEVERLPPSTVAMVGDRKHDVLGAKQNGLFAVGVTYGYGSEAELREAEADVLCRTVEEVTAFFSRVA